MEKINIEKITGIDPEIARAETLKKLQESNPALARVLSRLPTGTVPKNPEIIPNATGPRSYLEADALRHEKALTKHIPDNDR